jgi:hypothetical protein
MDRHKRSNAGMLVGVMMLSRIFKTIVSGHIECRLVLEC